MDTTRGYRRRHYEKRVDLAGEYRWGDIGQLVMLTVFSIGLLADLFFVKVSSSWQNVIPWYFRVIISIPLSFISGYLAQNGLNQVFGEERQTLQVIQSGVFGMVRHPIYLGSILIFLSFVMLSLSVVALSVWLVIVLFYYYLCRYEEILLIEKLGEEYTDYRDKVPMLIPGIKKVIKGVK